MRVDSYLKEDDTDLVKQYITLLVHWIELDNNDCGSVELEGKLDKLWYSMSDEEILRTDEIVELYNKENQNES
jgi:hypothetical protein